MSTPTEKQVILFLVEGMTDRLAFEGIFPELLGENYRVEFCVFKQHDVTSDKHNNVSSITEAISESVMEHISTITSEVEEHIQRSRIYTIDDVAYIVHLIDTDGGFVSDEHIEQFAVDNITYLLDKIQTNNYLAICKRNRNKTEIVSRLYMERLICDRPYKIYYFSRNREHVLQDVDVDNTNNSDGHLNKLDLAANFDDAYFENPSEFLKLLEASDILVPGTYQRTWKFIMQETNSLKRYTNFRLFFKEFGI